jgi:hypothetical protein
MDQFQYNEDFSFDVNFNEWHYLNNAEREMYNEKPLNRTEAYLIFFDLFGEKNTQKG